MILSQPQNSPLLGQVQLVTGGSGQNQQYVISTGGSHSGSNQNQVQLVTSGSNPNQQYVISTGGSQSGSNQNQFVISTGSQGSNQPQQYVIQTGGAQPQLMVAQPQTALVSGHQQTVLVAQTPNQQGTTSKTIIILQPQSGSAGQQKIVVTPQG